MALTPEEQQELDSIQAELAQLRSPASPVAAAPPQGDLAGKAYSSSVGYLKGLGQFATVPADLVYRGGIGALDYMTGSESDPSEVAKFAPTNVLRGAIDKLTSGPSTGGMFNYTPNKSYEVGGEIAGGIAGLVTNAPTALPSAMKAASRMGPLAGATTVLGTSALEGGAVGAAYEAQKESPDYLSGAETGAAANVLGTVAGLGASKAIGVGKNIAESATDWWRGGPPAAVRAVEEAPFEGIIASKLGYTKDTTTQRIARLESADYEQAFARNNPVAGIDTTQNGALQIKQLETNLGGVAQKAVGTKNAIIADVSTAEQQAIAAARASGQEAKIGVAFEDVPQRVQTQSGTYGLEDIAVQYGDDGAKGVGQATDYMKREFGIAQTAPRYEGDPMVALTPSRRLTTSEADTLKTKIDGQIREWGGYDEASLANSGRTPSQVDGYVEALRFYRRQIDEAVKGHISSLVGDDAAKAFTQANQDYAMTKNFEPIVENFKTQTVRPMGTQPVPMTQQSSPSGSIKGAIIESVSPGRAKNQASAQAQANPGQVINELQMIVEAKNNPYTKPLPRGVSQILSSFPAKEMLTNIASKMGLVPMGVDISKIPLPVLEQITGQVAGTMPELFEPTPDNVNVINGKLQSPYDQAILMQQASEKSAIERAKTVPDLWRKKHVPQTAVPAPMAAAPTQPAIPDMNQLNSLFSSQYGAQLPMQTDAQDMVSQLKEITAYQNSHVQ